MASTEERSLVGHQNSAHGLARILQRFYVEAFEFDLHQSSLVQAFQERWRLTLNTYSLFKIFHPRSI